MLKQRNTHEYTHSWALYKNSYRYRTRFAEGDIKNLEESREHFSKDSLASPGQRPGLAEGDAYKSTSSTSFSVIGVPKKRVPVRANRGASSVVRYAVVPHPGPG